MQYIAALSTDGGNNSGWEFLHTYDYLALNATDGGNNKGWIFPDSFMSKIMTDVGAGVDAISEFLATVPITDAGSGADIISALQNEFLVSDTGEGADAVVLLLELANITDSGVGVDIVSEILRQITIADEGEGADALEILNTFLLSDVGAGVDEIGMLRELFLVDTGAGVDVVLVKGDQLKIIAKITNPVIIGRIKELKNNGRIKSIDIKTPGFVDTIKDKITKGTDALIGNEEENIPELKIVGTLFDSELNQALKTRKNGENNVKNL